MPVGTKGTIKGVPSEQLVRIKSHRPLFACHPRLTHPPALSHPHPPSPPQLNPELSPQIILGNTYHLALQPGTELLEAMGGLHEFMAWPNNLLTDSGGFQMVSLLALARVRACVRLSHCV